MIISEINGVITLCGRIFGVLKKLFDLWKRRRKSEVSVPRRFVELFEAHGVHRNQIPRFFGHDISLSDLANDEALLKKLTEPVLEAACTRFAVRREWLDGAGEDPYIRHHFYQEPQSFERFIDGLKSANSGAGIDGYLIVPKDQSSGLTAALILAESIGAVGETPIYRYHFCDEWVFRYWKSRAYLTSCVAIATRKRVFIKGRFVEARDLSALRGGHFPKTVLNRLCLTEKRWHAEDLALLPDQYLAGLDHERNEFGITSALRLWLELDSEGWMDAGLVKGVRPEFEKRLAQYEASSIRQ